MEKINVKEIEYHAQEIDRLYDMRNVNVNQPPNATSRTRKESNKQKKNKG